MTKLKSIRCFFLMLLSLSPARVSAQLLPVEDFLNQVSNANEGYQALQMETDGAEKTVGAASLFFKPQVFTQFQYIYDTRDTHAPDIEGKRDIQKSASAGLRQQTPFGLQLQLSMDYSHSTLLGANSPLVTRPSITNLYPVPILNFPIWQNFLGKMDHANSRLLEAQSRASAYGSSFAARAILTDAEGRYWKLAILREALTLQRASLIRAHGVLSVENRKERRKLIDSSDVLLGEAAVQGKELELKSMLIEERSAGRAFNSARGIDSDLVAEDLPIPDVAELSQLTSPSRKDRRGDVRAAEQQFIATSAGTEVAREKLLPSFNIYGSVFAVGVAFSMPLDPEPAREARDGYARQGAASELTYRRKVFEEDNDWKELAARFTDNRERLSLALKLEEIQRRKFEDVRRRRGRGLTVAFQVFQYELDFLSAAQARLQIEGILLGIRAQMKLFGPER